MHALKTVHDDTTQQDILVFPLKKETMSDLIEDSQGKYPLFRSYRRRSQRFDMRVSAAERLLLEKAVMKYPGQDKTSILITALLEFCDRYNITLETES